MFFVFEICRHEDKEKIVTKNIFSNRKWFHTFASENQEEKFD